MNRWGQSKTERGQTDDVGSGHGNGGRQAQPAELGRCRRTQPADDPTAQASKKQLLQTIRPVQASQQTNSQQTSLAGLLSCSVGWWRECGGAGHSEGGLRPTYLSPSHLSPLPVSVHTHSHNLYKTQFSPNLFFCCFYFHFTPH